MSATCIPRLLYSDAREQMPSPKKNGRTRETMRQKNRTRKDHGSDRHGPRIPDGIRENDPAPDRLSSKNHLRSVEMNRQNPTLKKLPIRDDTKGRLLLGRRNRSKTSFEDSVTSNELRMAFEVNTNKFEVPIRLRAKIFEYLRIPLRHTSNHFGLLRMNPALPPD